MRRCCLLFLAISCAFAAAAEEITFPALLGEMTDLSRLARWPEPSYTTRQFSSYDRKSTDPAVQTDENWYANADRGQHLRSEEYKGKTVKVLMDAEGPGAIVHFWSANPKDAGNVMIFLDGADTPVVDAPLTEWLGGTHPWAPKPIGAETARGWNSYLPIPYAKHCKVVTTEGYFYYIINYRTYAQGTQVMSFTPEQAQASLDDIRIAAAQLADASNVVTSGLEDGTLHNKTVELKGGAEQEVLRAEGPAAVGAMALALQSDDLEAVLRATLLEITFDDAAVPQVRVPAGDFFGSAPGINPFIALPCGTAGKSILYSKWVMPFEKNVSLRLRNTGRATAEGQLTVMTIPWQWDARSLHFHATWRGDLQIPTRPRQDWNFVEAQGRGRYVGTSLHIVNPVKDWWGEGDEKVYVDGETFPSWFGTGSEDYFGYAWCSPELFTHAYHNQPRCDGPANYGHTSVNRFHIMDDIPFTRAISFNIEVWHWAETKVDMFGTAWWYAAPGATSNRAEVDPATLIVPEVSGMVLKRVEGALEGEKLKVVSVSGGQTQTQVSEAWDWSSAAQLWWVDNQPGNRLEISFPVEKRGTYEVFAVFTKAGDYGMAQLAINGVKIGEPMDFYNDGVVATGEISLGTHTFRRGDQRLSVEITGKNEKAVPKYMFGLDYIRLVAK